MRVACTALLMLLLTGCGGGAPESQPVAAPENVNESPTYAAHSTTIEKLPDPAGIQNLLRLSATIYSGSEPHGEEGFASLASLGVKTIVSVDGARPNLELARQHGLQYVHIPIGYDGVPKKAGDSLARLVRQTEGVIYVHCHHGQHRGPAAAAVACMAAGASPVEGKAILEAAGTGQNYPGLWRDVAAYSPPPDDAVLPELVEIAEVESFAAAMAKIDRNFDNLKLCQQAGWSVPDDHPDLVAQQEALILKEGLRETARNLVEDSDARFKTWLSESEALAEQVEIALRQKDPARATMQMKLLEDSCKRCHGKYRNG